MDKIKDLRIIEARSAKKACEKYANDYEKAFPRSPMIGNLDLVVAEYKW